MRRLAIGAQAGSLPHICRDLQYKFMAKFKPAGSTKKLPAKSARAAIPCLILVLLGIAAMCLLFYLSLQSGTS